MTQYISPSASASISPPSILSSSATSPPSTSTSQSSRAQSQSKGSSDSPTQPIFGQVQAPVTPQRGRTRYPANLARDPNRVPLHRRGTSKTYERLEDLLKEAGYKETRVFTPEAERFENDEGKKGKSTEGSSRTRGGVGAVVGFLAGLVTAGQERKDGTEVEDDERDDEDVTAIPTQATAKERQPPLTGSPLPHKFTLSSPLRQTSFPSTDSQETIHPYSSSLVRSPSPTPVPSGYTSLVSSRPSSRLRRHSPTSHHHHHPPQSPKQTVFDRQFSFSQLSQDIPHHNPVRPQPSLPSHMQTYAQASAARNYLRHMASAPNFPRSRATPQHATSTAGRSSAAPSSADIHSDAEDETRPPMPPSWFETVAKAILGIPGSHMGGPSSASGGADLQRSRSSVSAKSAPAIRGPRNIRSLPHSQVTSATPSRANTLRGRRSQRGPPQDITNSHQEVSGRPSMTARPSLLMVDRVNPMNAKASCSVGSVVKTNVVCRSAPVSRETSRVRTTTDGSTRRDAAVQASSMRGKGGGRSRAFLSGSRKAAGTRKGSRKGRDAVLSLSTRVEGHDFDVWGRPSRSSLDFDGDYFSDDDEGDESEEGEIDLARLLVNPKRQHSIQSLRKHLDRERRAAPLPRPPLSLTRSYPHSATSSPGKGRKPRDLGLMESWASEDVDDDRGVDGRVDATHQTSDGREYEGEGVRLAGSSAIRDGDSTKRSRRGLPKGWSEEGVSP